MIAGMPSNKSGKAKTGIPNVVFLLEIWVPAYSVKLQLCFTAETWTLVSTAKLKTLVDESVQEPS